MFILKKLLVAFLICPLIFLTSCTGNIKGRELCVKRPVGFVSVETDGTQYKAEIEYTDTGVMTVSLVAPIKGITVIADYNGYKLKYGDMQLDYSPEQAEYFQPFFGLYDLLKTVCGTEPKSIREEGECFTLSFDSGLNDLNAVIDAEGTLTRLEADGLVFSFA